MTHDVFEAIYKSVDKKSTEELLDIVNLHLSDYTPEFQRMVAVVLSKRKVEFSLDNFPPHLCDCLYYYEKETKYSYGYVILAIVGLVVSFFFAFEFASDNNQSLRAATILVGMIFTYIFVHIASKEEDVRVDVACTGIGGNDNDIVKQSNDNNMEPKTTSGIILKALDKLNCQYNVEEHQIDEGKFIYDIFFTFQAQNFVIRCFDDNISVVLYYMAWCDEKMENTKMIEKLKAVVNETNLQSDVTCFYDKHEEDNSMIINSKYQFYLLPTMPAVDDLIVAIMNNCFQQRRVFEQILIQKMSDDKDKKQPDFNYSVRGEC